MSEPAVSKRTQIRDAFFNALAQISTANASRAYRTTATVEKLWLQYDQFVRYPGLCVIVTDEQVASDSHQSFRSECDVKIVGYSSNDKDPRAALDAIIEDTLEALSRNDESIRSIVSGLQLEEIACDDGAEVSKPFGKFVMTWKCSFTRRFGFNS